MALNSGVTADGKEMGRAQIAQAEAAGIEPQVDMNPVLLKPVSEQGSQVIVAGKAIGTMSASAYYQMKRTLWKSVIESYDRLAAQYEVIVLEGAGSPAEINLKDNDIVNMAMAEYAGAATILVADIDRGGVFASIIGTMELLTPRERRHIIGFIINKFRGDKRLLESGLTMLERRTERPVFGVLPYLKHLYIPGEDSMSLDRTTFEERSSTALVSVGIIRLPHLSNYTDFEPLLYDPRFAAHYVTSARQLARCDVCILPGSKNVFYDMQFLHTQGLADALREYYQHGGKIVGICGGYQLLGTVIYDPFGVESTDREVQGIGLLPLATTLHREKTTQRITAPLQLPGQASACVVTGYEIHMGTSEIVHHAAVQQLTSDQNLQASAGSASSDGRVWGTYIHGLFESDEMRRALLRWSGNNVAEELPDFSYQSFKETCYEYLADAVEQHLDVSRMLAAIGITFHESGKSTFPLCTEPQSC